jgi:hypothetical protein
MSPHTILVAMWKKTCFSLLLKIAARVDEFRNASRWVVAGVDKLIACQKRSAGASVPFDAVVFKFVDTDAGHQFTEQQGRRVTTSLIISAQSNAIDAWESEVSHRVKNATAACK